MKTWQRVSNILVTKPNVLNDIIMTNGGGSVNLEVIDFQLQIGQRQQGEDCLFIKSSVSMIRRTCDYKQGLYVKSLKKNTDTSRM